MRDHAGVGASGRELYLVSGGGHQCGGAEQQCESGISGGLCWSWTPCRSYHWEGDRIHCVEGEQQRADPLQCKPMWKCSFILSTLISNLHYVRYREFQTEYLLCDCNILWMHRWVKERNITVRDTRCVYPKSLQAQPVTGVKQELLTCGEGERNQKAFTEFYLPPCFSWQTITLSLHFDGTE